MFSILSGTNFNFYLAFILLSAKAFNLDRSKILWFGKELIKSEGKFEFSVSNSFRNN